MKTILISNPFLSPQPSGDNEEESALLETRKEILRDYILYTFKEFDKAWTLESQQNSDSQTKELQDLLFPDYPTPTSSPTFASTEFAFQSDALMDNSLGTPLTSNLMSDIGNFDCDDLAEFWDVDMSAELSEYQKELEKEKEKQAAKGGVEDSTMFYNHEFTDNGSGSQSQTMSQSWINGEDGFDLLEISANDPDPPVASPMPTTSITTVNIDALRNVVALPLTEAPAVKLEPSTAAPRTVVSTGLIESSGRPTTRTRRKSVQTSRNVQDAILINEESIDLLPNNLAFESKPTLALVTLNGIANRTRNISATSTSLALAPTESSVARSSKSAEEKRKRKYEFEDDNDPSVKNAKAAKLNRDKKKRQMQELQKVNSEQSALIEKQRQQIEETARNSHLSETALKQEIERLTRELNTERLKNSETSMTKVTMLDYVTKVVSAMQPTPSVFLSERLASTPMPNAPEMQEILRNRQNGGIPSQQNPNGTYLTFKVGIGGRPSISIDCENSKD